MYKTEVRISKPQDLKDTERRLVLYEQAKQGQLREGIEKR